MPRGRRLTIERAENNLELAFIIVVGNYKGLLVHKATCSRSDHHRSVESLECARIYGLASSCCVIDYDLLHPTSCSNL
jgi:hypothetical protein